MKPDCSAASRPRNPNRQPASKMRTQRRLEKNINRNKAHVRPRIAISASDEFFCAPYGDRQLITFVEDSLLDSPPQNILDLLNTPAAKIGAAAVTVVLGGIVGLSLAAGAYSFFRSRQSKESPGQILFIRKSWACDFTLPPGHPRTHVVFVGHPAEPRNYMPLADFHRYTFDHKFSEILSILMHLGATTIQVKHIRGWGHDFTQKLSAGIPQFEAGQSVTASRRERSVILYEAELNGSDTVSLPDNLVWFPHESTWKQVVDGRVKFGLTKFSLTLQYQEDYGINLKLKGRVGKLGLDLGGQFLQHESTTWEIHGRFRAKA
jgi:hypothetical protein